MDGNEGGDNIFRLYQIASGVFVSICIGNLVYWKFCRCCPMVGTLIFNTFAFGYNENKTYGNRIEY